MSNAPAGWRWRRLLPVLLLVSVAINLLLIGAFLGRWSMPMPPPPHGPGGMMRHMVDEMGRDMNAADRTILENAYQAHAHDLDASGADHRMVFDAIRQAMGAEPFDRAALEKALDAAGKQGTAERSAIEQTLLDAASQMSADGRQHLAHWQPGPPSDRH